MSNAQGKSEFRFTAPQSIELEGQTFPARPVHFSLIEGQTIFEGNIVLSAPIPLGGAGAKAPNSRERETPTFTTPHGAAIGQRVGLRDGDIAAIYPFLAFRGVPLSSFPGIRSSSPPTALGAVGQVPLV